MADQQQQELRKSVTLEKKDTSPSNQSQNGPIEPGDLEALTQYVQELMQQMQDKFANMSEQILSRIDDMSHRIEDIERNVTDISAQTGLDSSSTPTNATATQSAPPQGKENIPETTKEEKQ
ncbi:heat shock factor-binding protein 1 [Galendromus occidentalis]|uniref:Heat shock factor-binding protein 1 n=1 Tax=Galendromus occidentalis TaxID=34638 RepID=A0AAJ7L775_9ACAR|nr:heat shock factor-binding protein 1 [Galendromus occidentalis]